MKVIISLFIVCCFLFFNAVQAAIPLDVVINEIAWIGTEVVGIESKNWWRYEWLELYNNTQNPILLDGWKIELYRTELDWTLELKGTIPPESYFLIVSSDKIFPDYDLNYSNLGGKLNNNGQKVILKDNSGNIVDTIDCFSYGKWFTGDNLTKQTMERKSPKSEGNIANNWQSSLSANGTPKMINFSQQLNPTVSPNPSPSPTPMPSPTNNPPATEASNDAIAPTNIFADSLKISEFIPNPKDNNGWIELYSDSGQKADISNWKLKSGDKTFIIPSQTFISPDELLVFGAKTTGLALKNSDSSLELYYPNGEIAQKIDYKDAKEGWSIAKIGNEYLWTNNPTLGSPNQKSASQQPQPTPPNPPKEQNLNYQTTPEPTPLETELSPMPEEILKENAVNKSKENILNSPWLGFILIIIFGFLAGLGLVKIRK